MSSEEDDITIGEKEWGESMYVTLFEGMYTITCMLGLGFINTLYLEMLQEVLTHEGYLFCAEEIKCLMDYNTLSCMYPCSTYHGRAHLETQTGDATFLYACACAKQIPGSG